MNKKILIICLVVVIALSALGLSACKDNSETEMLREISNAMLDDYAKVTLSVMTHTDKADLNAKYVINTSDDVTEISYEVERLNSFGDNGDVPSEFISVVTGTATIKNDAIVSVDGETLAETIILDVADRNMTFRKSYLDITKVFDDGMSAKVINPKGFLKNDDFAGTDMTVRVVMSQSALSKITLAYSLNGAKISLEYVFVR